MLWIVLGGVLVAGLIVFLVLRARARRVPTRVATFSSAGASPQQVARPAPAPTAAKAKPAAPVWGKRLVIDQATACQTARILAGQCFPMGKVPGLPLKDCGNSACRCHFEPMTERRSGAERREGHERREQIRFEDQHERRSGKPRRKDEHYTWHTTI
jgi:hypothetical protein